ncbi:MAG: glycosyltransferase family 39 protein [Anaerolineae bacterium]|nr:glycosyltransferase family 39 protein [Anaerolineae bacterium]
MKKALGLVVLLTLLAAAVRVCQLDRVPLRGDEAFTVRFWAQNPAETWNDLAQREPHPMGAFVLFWGWKQLAGDSEFAMRALPLLLNLPGAALMMALGRRFIRSWAAVWMLGLLWAVNPFQVWHAQDARNYAIWSVLSTLAMWLFLKAVQRSQPRDWILYALAEIAALYVFLLEPFFVLVQVVYLFLFHRGRVKSAFLTWGMVMIALIPWFIQLSRLSGSGYEGTAQKVSLEALVSEFIPTILFGEVAISGMTGAVLMTVLLVGLGSGGRKQLSTRLLLILWIFAPLILLMIAGTRLSVFRPRYVIPITPAVLLSLLWIGFQAKGSKRSLPLLPAVITAVLVGVSLYSLNDYFYEAPPKAPDWRSLARFIENRDYPNDLVLVTNLDPAFGYYYHGEAEEIPWSAIQDYAALLEPGRGVFVQVGDNTFAASLYLQENAQLIPPVLELVKQFRPYYTEVNEIENPLDLQVGDVAWLRGYTLLGGDEFGLTIFLYWQPLRRTETEHVAFVHVLDEGGAYVAGEDHVPLNHNASTTAWIPGSLLRDAFAVRVPPGTYTLEIGMYDSVTKTRLSIQDALGNSLGDRFLSDRVEVK